MNEIIQWERVGVNNLIQQGEEGPRSLNETATSVFRKFSERQSFSISRTSLVASQLLVVIRSLNIEQTVSSKRSVGVIEHMPSINSMSLNGI